MGRVKHKTCENCGADFVKSPAVSYEVFSCRRFCGRDCAAQASGVARTIIRPAGWRRDRSKEKPWAEISIRHHTRLSFLCAKAKSRAKRHGLPHDIDTPYLLELWEETGGRCRLTGRRFNLDKWGAKNCTGPDAPSVDRIEPALGYVRGNVRLVTAHVNFALASFGEEALRRLCADILGFGRDDEW